MCCAILLTFTFKNSPLPESLWIHPWFTMACSFPCIVLQLPNKTWFYFDFNLFVFLLVSRPQRGHRQEEGVSCRIEAGLSGVLIRQSSQSGRKYLLLNIRQRTNNQNIQEAQKTKLPPNQWTNKEVGNWTKQNFFKGRNPSGQKAHEKMLTIPGHKGNANQNHTKILPHP
jgi:hypothetical protein